MSYFLLLFGRSECCCQSQKTSGPFRPSCNKQGWDILNMLSILFVHIQCPFPLQWISLAMASNLPPTYSHCRILEEMQIIPGIGAASLACAMQSSVKQAGLWRAAQGCGISEAKRSFRNIVKWSHRPIGLQFPGSKDATTDSWHR